MRYCIRIIYLVEDKRSQCDEEDDEELLYNGLRHRKEF